MTEELQVDAAHADCWSTRGLDWLAGLDLPQGSREVVDDFLLLIEAVHVLGPDQRAP